MSYSTPIKYITNTVIEGPNMRVAQAKEDASREIKNNTYLTETTEFLDAMFPFYDTAERVYAHLCEEGIYDTHTSMWAGTPKDGAPEKDYYPFFVDRAKDMKKSYLELPNANKEAYMFLTEWIENPNSAPKSIADIASEARPDVSCLIQSKEETKYHSQLEQLEDEIKKQQNAVTKARGDEAKLAERRAALKKNLSVWWSRINVVVEIKKKVASIEKHLVQLVVYLQQVLRNQLDRRSAIGLLFCKNELAVWHADRSGVFGTGKAFNIHKEPVRFIQVILGCTLGKPSTLGYDTSMKLWVASKNIALPSYHPDVPPEEWRRNNLEKNWVIEMPGKSTGEREEFLTIRAISTTRASNISGRATIVWVAMKYKAIGVRNHQIYVLKQCWRPTTADAEGTLIPSGVANITRVHSCEDVRDDNTKVTTVEYLRHNRGHKLPILHQSPQDIVAQQKQLEKIETSETKAVVFTLLDQTYTITRHTPISRVQSRLVCEDYGWPIHRFRDLNEFLLILKEVVEAQKALYFKENMLQRDISVGNILIVPSDDEALKTHAYLIDYDYAKRTKKPMPSVLGALHRIPGKWVSELAIAVGKEHLAEDFNCCIHPDLDRLINTYLPAGTFLPAIFGISIRGKPTELTSRNLGLLSKDETLPDFRETTAQSRERSATIPFASCEILFSARMFRQPLKRPLADHSDLPHFRRHIGDRTEPRVFHDAVHDMEALFWILTFICLTRSGPGSNRRQELQQDPNNPKTSEPDRQLHALCRDLFVETNLATMASHKVAVLGASRNEDGDSGVTTLFADYFKPLSDLWVEWRQIIELAHGHPIFEGIHDFVLDALNRTIDVVASRPEQCPEEAKKVAVERQAELDYFRNFPTKRADDTQAPPPIVTHDLSPNRPLIGIQPNVDGGNDDSPGESPSDGPAAAKKLRTDSDNA